VRGSFCFLGEACCEPVRGCIYFMGESNCDGISIFSGGEDYHIFGMVEL
jgi:hypothetical protein